MFGSLPNGTLTPTKGQTQPPVILAEQMVTARTHATQALAKAAELMKEILQCPNETINPHSL